MFLYRMNDKEKRSFLVLAKMFIECDGLLSEKETELLRCLANESCVNISEIPENADMADNARKFESRASRICALLELIGLGHADSDYSIEETKFVKNLALEWKVSEAELLLLENWVLRLLAMMLEAQTLIDGKE